MRNFLITGGSGFFGELLKQRLLSLGYFCVNIDLEKDYNGHENLISIQGDIRNIKTLEELFNQYRFDAIFHCAAILAHETRDRDFLWTSNVNGTRNIADFAERFSVERLIFTSSNCLWGHNFHRPVLEEDEPAPVEIYGRSKWEAEKILLGYQNRFHVIIIRCPTIMDYGRLGLLSILFEFIDEGRKVWVVGGGRNRYQFIYAQDLIDACLAALAYEKSAIFNIGSENVSSFYDVYNHVIKEANTGAKVTSLPRMPTIFLMKMFHKLGLSPLGPYQYKMIAEDFIFDITRIKRELNWRPTLTNQEMLLKAFEYYRDNKTEINRRKNVSAHKKAARMGIIKLLKWIS